MSGGVRGELRDAGVQSDPAHHLGPGPQRQRLGAVAPRLRQEQRSPCPADRGPVDQVGRQQHPGRRRVRHNPLQVVLRRLRPHPQQAARRVQVVGAQRAQLLTAQARRRRPARASAGCGPARGRRQPGSPATPARWESTAAWSASARDRTDGCPRSLAGGSGPADRVGLAQPFLHQEVVKQPHWNQPLQDRGVRQARTGVDRHDIAAPPARARAELPHVDRDVRAASRRPGPYPPARTRPGTRPGPGRTRRPCAAPAPGPPRSPATPPPGRASQGQATCLPASPPRPTARLVAALVSPPERYRAQSTARTSTLRDST